VKYPHRILDSSLEQVLEWDLVSRDAHLRCRQNQAALESGKCALLHCPAQEQRKQG
jgi:hypothetical protein